MRGNRDALASIRDEDLIEVFSRRLPDLLERRPDLEQTIFTAFLKTFARREEVALVLTELRAFRTEADQRSERSEREMREFRAEADQRFERSEREMREFRTEVDQRFERSEQETREFRSDVAARFDDVQRSIDRLGARWGIRNESLFRQTMAAVLEQSFGVSVQQRTIAGEQFDVLIHDHEHILVEIAASVGPTIKTRLERKRRVYEESTGTTPTRVILATASIHSRRAQELQRIGIEVIEPDDAEGPAGAQQP